MKSKIKNHLTLIACSIFVFFSAWWVVLQFTTEPDSIVREWFSATYCIMALFGSVIGIKIAKEWGGWKSLIGRGMLMLSFGLLAQVFGQVTYSLYTLLFHVEVPYPSVGDIGYFGMIPIYIYAVWLFGKALGGNISMRSFKNKLQAIILPILLLAGSYWIFLRNYTFDWDHPLTVFLDWVYPLGPAVFISLAILVFLFSRKYLGGIMRTAILLVLFALLLQYIADFVFLYTVNNETWTTAAYNDYQYFIAYFVMTLAIIRFNVAFEKISGKQNVPESVPEKVEAK